MAVVVSVCQHKGGVGKTTTTLNLAGCLASRGYKVLVIDMDPQENATIGAGIISDTTDGMDTIVGVIKHKTPLDSVMRYSEKNGFWVVPSHYSLTTLDMELVSRPAREWLLDRALDAVRDRFDWILIDTQPHLGIGTLMAVVAAQKIIVPLKLDFYSLRGLSMFLEFTNMLHEALKINPEIRFLCTMRRRTKLSMEAEQEIRAHLGDRVFKTVIPLNVTLEEAPSHGVVINVYDPKSPGGLAYEALTDELLGNLVSVEVAS